MSSFLNYFYSNPFHTPIGQLIEKSTDGTQVSEDWTAYMQICDLINSTQDGPREASRAIRKQLFNCAGKNTASVLFTLTILETCVKNCGRSFHLVISQKDFLQDLVKILLMKPPLPHVAQEKILSLLQTWDAAFKDVPELGEVGHVCAELKEKNIEFPVLDVHQAAPIITPNKRIVDKLEVDNSLDSIVPANPSSPKPDQNTITECVVSPIALDALKVAKLRSELDIVTRNCRIFNEMLSQCQPATEAEDDWKLMQELKEVVLEMRKRIVALIDKIQFEQLTCEMIPVCDDVNNVLLRFERYERARNNFKSQPNLVDLDNCTNESSAIMPEFLTEKTTIFSQFGPPYGSQDLITSGFKEVDIGAMSQNNQKSPHKYQPTNQSDLTSSLEFDKFLASKSDNSQPAGIIATNSASNFTPTKKKKVPTATLR